MKPVRYALAAVCFAASVGCLALWWRSMAYEDQLHCQLLGATQSEFAFASYVGYAATGVFEDVGQAAGKKWIIESRQLDPETARKLRGVMVSNGRFRHEGPLVLFPLWYPALIFALAGVGILRFRRQFSIRSALICVSVVAALLGMAVVL